jgi:hypothetical protein
MKLKVLWIIAIVFGMNLLTVGSEIGWLMPQTPGTIKGLPKWINNSSTGASVKKYKKGLLFTIPEAGKAYRWKLAVDELSLKTYPMLHLRYRAHGVNTTQKGSTNYTVYMSTLGKNKQKIFPVLGEQLKVDGKSHDIIINLYQQFKLSGQAKISRLIIGMSSATADATLAIEKLVIYSNSTKVIAAAKWIAIPRAKPISKATNSYAESTAIAYDKTKTAVHVEGWRSIATRGAKLKSSPRYNMLSNYDFEKKNGNILEDWSYELHGGATGKVEWDDTIAKSGLGSLKITKTNGKGYIVAYCEQAIKVNEGDKISFQGFYHTKNNRYQATTLGLVRLSPEKNDLRYDLSLDSWAGLQSQQYMINAHDNQWMKRLVSKKIKSKEEKIIVQIIIYGNPVTVWWDDLALEPTSVANKRWFKHYPRSVNFWRPKQVSEQQFKQKLDKDIDHNAELRQINGKSVIMVDGKPVPPVIFKECPISAQNFLGGPFDKAGVRLQMQMCDFGGMRSIDNSTKPGRYKTTREPGMFVGMNNYNFTKGLNLLKLAMKASPNSLFILDMYLNPYPKFVDDYPDSAWLNAKGQKGYGSDIHLKGFADKLPARRNWWASYFSSRYQAEMAKAMKLFFKELKKSGLSKRVIGFQIVGGHDGQFALSKPDYNPQALTAFKQYLRKKYGTNERLRQAWGQPDITFATARVPQPLNSTSRFLDPAKNIDWFDYYQFIKSEAIKIQERFAQIAKTALGKKVLVFKYLMDTHGGAPNSGWHIDQFLQSDTFDIATPQPSYHRRDPGLAYTFPQVFKSYHLNNKLCVGEFDLRTYFRTAYGELMTGKLGRSEDFAMWQSELRKLSGPMILRGHGYWYYDLHWGWFQKELVKDISQDYQLHRNLQKKILTETTTPAELLIVIDEQSLFWTSICSRKWTLEILLNSYPQLFAIGNSGVPFDYMLLEDLLRQPDLAAKYKVIVFNHSYRLDPQRRKLYDSLKNNNRVLIWLYGAGFVHDKSRSVAGIKALTGIKVKHSTKIIDKSVLVSGRHPLTKGLAPKQDISSIFRATFSLPAYPHEYYDGPYFYIDDPKTEIIAAYQQTNQGAIGIKKFSNWTSVYIASAGGLSAELLNNICRSAGIYVVTKPGLDITVTNNFMTIHGVVPGYYTLTFPHIGNISNLKTGEIIARNKKSIHLWVDPQTTYWLKIR